MQIVQWHKGVSQKILRGQTALFDKALSKKVERILNEVRTRGDAALRYFTKEFDKIDLPVKRLRVSEGEINIAFERIQYSFVPLLKQIAENVRKFHQVELKKSFEVKGKDGTYLAKKYEPLERVGIYIPGGTAPLVSTVYMTVIPAKVAGVNEIVIATPPNRETGEIDPHILVAANLLGVNEIYRVGGAQAIAAMAFGTKTIAKVDKIAGPGNQYVTEAKRQVYGFADIDMIAGPSEIAIIATGDANQDFVTCDLLAQAEHFGGTAYLITNSKKLADAIRKRVDNGYIFLVSNLSEACEAANEIAPEHLEILTEHPERLVKKIRHAAAIFLGPYSPAVIGDYVAGPSHVLPTGGTARFFSPLGTFSFMKSTQIIGYTKEALSKTRDAIKKLTELEGLMLHRISLEAQFVNELKQTSNPPHQEAKK